jgi:hypothetical protein
MPTPAPRDEEEQRGQQDRAEQLHERCDVAPDGVVGGARSDRLRGVGNCRTGPESEAEHIDVERVADHRKQEDAAGAEDRDRGDREAHLAVVGLHHRCGGGDGGVAAHRAASSDEDGDAGLDTEEAAGEHGEGDTSAHGDEYEPEHLEPDRGDQVQIHAKAQKDDAEPEDVLDGQLDARHRPRRRAAQVDQDQPQEHGQRNLEADGERVGQGELGGEVGREAYCGRQEEAGQQFARKALHPFEPRPQRERETGRLGLEGTHMGQLPTHAGATAIRARVRDNV